MSKIKANNAWFANLELLVTTNDLNQKMRSLFPKFSNEEKQRILNELERELRLKELLK